MASCDTEIRIRKEVQRKTVLCAKLLSDGNLDHEETPVVFPSSKSIGQLYIICEIVTNELLYRENTYTTFDSIGLGYLTGLPLGDLRDTLSLLRFFSKYVRIFTVAYSTTIIVFQD